MALFEEDTKGVVAESASVFARRDVFGQAQFELVKVVVAELFDDEVADELRVHLVEILMVWYAEADVVFLLRFCGVEGALVDQPDVPGGVRGVGKLGAQTLECESCPWASVNLKLTAGALVKLDFAFVDWEADDAFSEQRFAADVEDW